MQVFRLETGIPHLLYNDSNACWCNEVRKWYNHSTGGSIGGTGGLDPSPGKSRMAIGLRRNFRTDPPREAIVPEGRIASRGWFVRPSVKTLMTIKRRQNQNMFLCLKEMSL